MKGGRYFMYLDIKQITGAINKISDLVSGDKTVPGVLFRLIKDDTSKDSGVLQVCYSDGHNKATMEEMSVVLEPTDYIGDVATYYEQLVPAIQGCQPHGKIEVDKLRIEYFPETLKLSVDQIVSYPDVTGENTVREKMGSKHIDIAKVDPLSTPKTKVLTLQKYDDIFKGEQVDEFEKSNFIDLLSRTSSEKGRLIYFSPKMQKAIVANQAYAVTCDIPKYTIDDAEVQAIKDELAKNGITDQASFDAIYKQKTDRLHQSVIISQQMAKSIISMLSKLNSDKIYIERADAFCNIFVDNDEEKFGIWFTMPKGSNLHTNFVEKHANLEYKTYQLTFLKDLLEGAVNQALSTTKSEKIDLKFSTQTNDSNGSIEHVVSIDGGSSSASTSNQSTFRIDDVVDSLGDLDTRSLNISLKIISDMLSQLKTEIIAFDVDISENGTTCVRIAEISMPARAEQYDIMREGLGDAPTPIERKLESRDKTLLVREYTMLK